MTYCHKLSRRLAICRYLLAISRYPGRSFSVIAPLLFLLACAPGELKEGFTEPGYRGDDVTEVRSPPTSRHSAPMKWCGSACAAEPTPAMS